MITIHCFVCGVDEVLEGRPGTGQPLERFKKLHAHAKGCGQCRFTCPCGDSIEFDHSVTLEDEEAFQADVDRIYAWARVHAQHMDDADIPDHLKGVKWTQWAN